MTFLKRLLIKNKKIGLVFVHEEGLALQIRSCTGSHLYWERFIASADIKSDNKAFHPGIPKASCWALIIPTYQCSTKYTVLPSTDPAEIERILEFELPNIVSYSTRPWIWDFSIIDRREDGTSKILIVLSPLTVIDHHVKNLSSLGIKPDVVITCAMFYTLLLSKQETLPESSPAGCFFISNDYMDFFVIENGRVVFLRGVRLTKELHENTGHIESEIRRSFSMVKEHGPATCPTQFFAINPNNSPADFAEIAKKALGSPVERIECDALYNEDSLVIDSLITVGPDDYLSPVPAKTRINLLPKHLKEKHLRSSKRRQLAVHGLKVCLVLFLAFLCLKTGIWRKNRLLESYEQRLSAISPVAEKLQFLQQQLSVIENQLQGNISTLDVIFELYKSLPKDITIHYLAIEQNKNIRTRAQAKLLSQSFDCIGPLEQSDFFQNVRQSYANQRRIGDSILIDFEIIADLQKTPPGKDGK